MDKKQMIKALESQFKTKAKYLGPPTFSYRIEIDKGPLSIDKDGLIRNEMGDIVSFEDLISSKFREQIDNMKGSKRQFNVTETPEILSVAVPLEMHTGKSLINLINMISSRQSLIYEAFGLDTMGLEIEFAKEIASKKPQSLSEFEKALKEIGPEKCQMLTFDFKERQIHFNIDSSELSEAEVNAFIDLVDLINSAALTASHSTSKPVITDNPKYTLRTWLLRLGMIGPKYKKSRMALLSRLSGSSAFRNVTKKDEE